MASNKFRAYLAAISYLDELVQPSYTLFAQIQATGYSYGFLSNAWHFDFQAVTVIKQHLSRLINGDVMLLLCSKS